MAGIAHIKENATNRELYYKVNRDLSIAIASAVKAAGVRQFILLSSMSVYGKTTGCITKDTKPKPRTTYGKSKLEADRAINRIAKESNGSFRFACLRPPMVYGKGCKGNYQALRNFALRSPIFPDYENHRSMLYIGNLCEFVKDCIDKERHGLFFPQNAEYVCTSEMVERIAAENGKKIRLSRMFNLGIKLLKKVNIVQKVFGDLVYEPVNLVSKFGFEESIKLTETTIPCTNLRILAICQYGWPEPYPSLYPMEEMAKRGHYVHAITGTPNYPMGEIFEGYKHNKNNEEDHNGIHITHVSVIPRKHDAIHRLLNYHSYPITAKRKLLGLSDDYDVVFANQSSPVMMVEPAIAYAKKHHKRVVMYCMDLWPASICVGGVKKDSAIYKFYWFLSKYVYKNVDVILVTSRMFKDYLTSEFDIDPRKIDYLPQYALSEFENFEPSSADSSCSKYTTDIVFAGNVGVAQNIIVVLRAAKIIQDEEITDHGNKILFHIIGYGQALESLQTYAKEKKIENVIFYGRKPSEEMPKYYAMADAMLVTMLPDPLVSLTLPAKVQSYMAAGKPIIASADGEIRNAIEESGCGLCAKGDDEKDLVAKIREFSNVLDSRVVMGRKAREYYMKNFSVKIVMDKLERVLRENCG